MSYITAVARAKVRTTAIIDYLQTAQRYSTFVTAHLPPNAYEAALEEATKIRQDAIAVADERERYENSLVRSDLLLCGATVLATEVLTRFLDVIQTSLQSFSEYLMWESTPRRAPRRQKGRSQPKPQDIPPDPILVVALYERAIAEAASQRAAILGTISIDGTLQNEEALPAAEAWLGSFWDGLTSFLVSDRSVTQVVRYLRTGSSFFRAFTIARACSE